MSAMPSQSASDRITPVGLFGVARKIARVRGVIAASSAARSGWKPALAGAGARTSVAPEAPIAAG